MTDEEHEEFREEMKEQNEEIRAYLDSLGDDSVDAALDGVRPPDGHPR